MEHAKIAIIGTGSVGSTAAYALILKNIASEIILTDINKELCKGEVHDLSDALPFSSTSQVRVGSLKDASHADIIIITAGARQKVGQKRSELLKTNCAIVKQIISDMKPIQPNAIIIIVSNPLDILTLCAQQVSGLDRSQVFGTGTFLDTQRLRGVLSRKLSIAQQSIHAYILGEHGDTQFAAWSTATIAGIPIIEFPELTQKELEKIAQQAKARAYEIIECKGATYFGIATCVAAMCENIVYDTKRVLPLSLYAPEFDVCLSMPAVLGESGIEQILPPPLSTKEQLQLEKSSEYLQKLAKEFHLYKN